MDDEEAVSRRRQEKERQRLPHHKYRDILQQLADRTVDEITIDLDDLRTVCLGFNNSAAGAIADAEAVGTP